MSDAIYMELAGGMNTLNTELTKAFARDGIRCFLLKRAQSSGNFSVVAEVQDGFFSEWSNYREATVFSFATTDDTFADSFSQATHIGYGVPDSQNEVEVFVFVADQIDKVVPDGTSPFYKGFARKDGKERFTVT